MCNYVKLSGSPNPVENNGGEKVFAEPQKKRRFLKMRNRPGETISGVKPVFMPA
jgi:hypothetical protein